MSKIYLDNQSTTPVDSEVLKSMIPYFSNNFGNASSKSHSFGWEAEAAIEIAREKIANLIGCESNEIYFTSGATESNNIILSNFSGSENQVVTATTEHRAILDVCKKLEECTEVKYLKPEKNGLINNKKIERQLTNKTSILSIMHANNEIGVIHPLNEIGKICKRKNVLLHVDAAQSLGKIPIDVKKMNVDFMSLSSHKIYGPKGVGAVYISNKHIKTIRPLLYGGGQERSIRPGTLPVPLIVGFGQACIIADEIMGDEASRIKNLREILIKEIKSKIVNVIINGDLEKRIPGNLNLSFPKLNGQSILNSMPKIAVSSGSACTSSSPKPSHVLTEIGLSKKLTNSSIRIGIGRFNTLEEINIAAESIINAVKLKTR